MKKKDKSQNDDDKKRTRNARGLGRRGLFAL